MDTSVSLAYKLIFGAVVVVFIFTTGYFFGWRNQHDSLVRYLAQVEQASKDAISQKNALILEGSNQHEKDQQLIDFLRTESGSVRIHLPGNCPDTHGKTDQDGTARIFSNRMDETFARLQAGTSRLIERCDQLNIDAIRSNTENR